MTLTHCLFFLALLLIEFTPALCTSTVEFYKDKSCDTSIGKVNGTTDGVCHQAIGTDLGARVLELDQGCAATIYTDPFCSDNATIANLNICMSGALIAGSFSIDCQNSASSQAAFTQSGAVPTSSPSEDSTNAQSKPSIPQAAVIAAVAGASVVAVSLLPICYFIRRRHLRRKAARRASKDVNAKLAMSPMELAGSEKAELPQDGSTMGPGGLGIGTVVPQLQIPIEIPRHSPSQRTIPMVSPLTPGPGIAQARYEQARYSAIRETHGSPTTPERQWYKDKNLPAIPELQQPQRPGSYAELGTGEPLAMERSVSAVSSSSAGTQFTKSYASSKIIHGGEGFF